MTGTLARLRGLFEPRRPNLRLLDRFSGRLDEPLRLLFEEPSAGRAIADPLGRVVRASARLQEMVGTALDLAPGISLHQLFADADQGAIFEEISAILRDPPALPRPLTTLLVRHDSEPLAVSVTCAVLPGSDGSVEGVLLSVHDTSWQARLMAELAESQRWQTAGQLAGGVAHDFNNLLTAILGGADAIAGRSGHDPETLEDIGAIRATAGRGAALARQLLAFGRHQTVQPRVLAVNDVMLGIATVLRRLLGNRVRLELALEQPGRVVRVDPTGLDQVLVNLAMNARDAMADGGTLTLRTGELVLDRALPHGVETIAAGSYVLLEVQDTGLGISPEALPHIFEPHFTTRREAGGSGYGLATVHRIVRHCDGFVAVESVPGQGTRMRVYLPAWQGIADHVPVSVATPVDGAGQLGLGFPAQPVPPRGVVLLVDDEDVLRRVAERALLRRGWQVLAAATGGESLELLAGDPPPRLVAVVADLILPGMDGIALVRAVRHRLGRPGLPAVLVSGYAGEGVRAALTEPGGGETRFLAKPYDIKDLSSLLVELTL